MLPHLMKTHLSEMVEQKHHEFPYGLETLYSTLAQSTPPGGAAVHEGISCRARHHIFMMQSSEAVFNLGILLCFETTH